MCCLQILLFILSIALSCLTSAEELIHVFGYEKKEAKVPCSYGTGYESYNKYLCRNDCNDEDVLVTTPEMNSKYSISDDKLNRVFTTTISHLSYADAGKYWCGVSRTGKDIYTEVKLEVVRDSCCDSSTTVQSYEGGSVSISCPYDSRYQSNLKYICRGNQPSTCRQQAAVTSDNKRNRQFSLTDHRSTSFTVTITSVTQKDSGLYLCGVQRNTGLDVFSAVVLEVKENRCCNNSTKVQSYEGGSVSVSCPYESQYQSNLKYICRGNQPSTCWQQAAVTSNNKRNRQFSLTDDRSRSFTVTITSVTQKDSGSYLCGVQRNPGLDVFSAVVLEVKENRCCNNSTKVQSYEGGSVSISCPYESQYQSNLKYICRGNQPSTCWQQAAVTSNNRQNGHFNLTDDKSRSFTVTITSVTQKDSGSYLCGVQRSTGLDVFSAVVLEVKEWCCVKSNQLSGTVGRPLTMQCPYPPQHETNRKFLCKGDSHRNCKDMVMSSSSSNQTEHRFTLQDDISSRSFSVTIKELKAEDAGTYWCVSDSQRGAGNYNKIQLSVDVASFQSVVFIAPAVALPILIIVLVLVCKYKCQKVQGNAVELPRTTTKAADAEEVMGEADIYVNHDIAMSSKQRTSKQETETCPQYDDAEDDNDYQNFNISEDIYCNEFHSTGYRR
ncbi:polymeric immunoglobulin receptor-like isoform X2 [Channa argus]|uniref:polymeric immunoglobulin receptor-like isoform X2 n=1 Tax=Channa argus TaxID=215402 RepID=UPI00351F9B97